MIKMNKKGYMHYFFSIILILIIISLVLHLILHDNHINKCKNIAKIDYNMKNPYCISALYDSCSCTEQICKTNSCEYTDNKIEFKMK